MYIVVINSSYSTIMEGKRINTEALKELLIQNGLFTDAIDDIFDMYSNESVNSAMAKLRKTGTCPGSYYYCDCMCLWFY